MVEDLRTQEFEIPDDMLDTIQKNIETIINTFNIPEYNKLTVIKQINYMYSRTKYLSYTDELTNLGNRRSFDNEYSKEFARAQRYKNNLTLVMFDIDYFKNVNDTYGHQCGDYVLKTIASLALQTFRQTDMVFRTGGEEFSVILTETDINQAKIPLERFRKTIETMNMIYNNIQFNVTVSIGACYFDDFNISPNELIKNTDKALYEAKNSGRNKTILLACDYFQKNIK